MVSAIFIERPRLALVVSLVMVLTGVISLGKLPVAEYPEITPPTLHVSASYPGASAEVITQTVAMSQEKFLAINLASQRFTMNRNATLLFQIVTTPDIMITDKEMHLYSHIGQLGYFSQKTGISFRNNKLEFVPEVKHIAQQINSSRPVLDTVEKANQPTFLRTTMRYRT